MLISSLVQHFKERGYQTTLVQTHISWVILTGKFAYKIKKPVNLGFVDFSTLEKRKRYCQEEIRLNRRLAPDLYIAAVPITGPEQNPEIDGDGPILEYAVKLRQFNPEQQLDRLIDHHALNHLHMTQIANIVANFHLHTPSVSSSVVNGRPEQAHDNALKNFEKLLALPHDETISFKLNKLQIWTQNTFAVLQPLMRQRKDNGFVKECHGDMHLANMALFHGNVTVFDCIEFNDAFRLIDVMSEVAFLLMDLFFRRRPDLACHFLNHYLSLTGDYAGLGVLRYYLVYRALVRAKVEGIRAHQINDDTAAKQAATDAVHVYLDLALTFTQPLPAYLIITHGLSGSGKTTLVKHLYDSLFFIHLRSDTERKRLHNRPITSQSPSGVQQGIYAHDITKATYDYLNAAAGMLLKERWPVVVDATFIDQSLRRSFAQLAQDLHVPFLILHCRASQTRMQQRIEQRSLTPGAISEATLEVLRYQSEQITPLGVEEQKHCLVIDTEQDLQVSELTERIKIALEGRDDSVMSARSQSPLNAPS